METNMETNQMDTLKVQIEGLLCHLDGVYKDSHRTGYDVRKEVRYFFSLLKKVEGRTSAEYVLSIIKNLHWNFLQWNLGNWEPKFILDLPQLVEVWEKRGYERPHNLPSYFKSLKGGVDFDTLQLLKEVDPEEKGTYIGEVYDYLQTLKPVKGKRVKIAFTYRNLRDKNGGILVGLYKDLLEYERLVFRNSTNPGPEWIPEDLQKLKTLKDRIQYGDYFTRENFDTIGEI